MMRTVKQATPSIWIRPYGLYSLEPRIGIPDFLQSAAAVLRLLTVVMAPPRRSILGMWAVQVRRSGHEPTVERTESSRRRDQTLATTGDALFQEPGSRFRRRSRVAVGFRRSILSAG